MLSFGLRFAVSIFDTNVQSECNEESNFSVHFASDVLNRDSDEGPLTIWSRLVCRIVWGWACDSSDVE
jgi:hypothetical protein